MDLSLSLLQLAVGVALLLGGAELFTEHAVKATKALRITPLALGLIFAGAEPEELFTAAIASAREAPGISLGTLIGANVTVITLVLGLVALIATLRFPRATLRKQGIITVVAITPAVGFLLWGRIPTWGGLLLVASYFAYLFYVVYRERLPVEVAETSSAEVVEGLAVASSNRTNAGHGQTRGQWLAVGAVLLSLAVMGGGGHFTVEGARDLAALLGITETAIGLSIVGLATSAEMIFLGVVPALKGHPEISLGGVLGSYVYNGTLALGVAALAGPLVAEDQGKTAIFTLYMLAALVVPLLMAREGALKRRAGLSLMAMYAIYLTLVFRIL